MAEGRSSAEEIAACKLREYFVTQGFELPIRAMLDEKAPGTIRLQVVDGEPGDAFWLTGSGQRIVVRGSNGRSVLYGVHRLIDWFRGDRKSDDLEVEERAHFRERWMAPTIHGRSDDPANFEYLTRLGVNTSYLRGRRDAFIEVKHFTHYVRDDRHLPQISQVCPPDDALRAVAQRACQLAQQHGLEVAMFQDEPTAIAGPGSKSDETKDALPTNLLKTFPADMLGAAYCHRYRSDGWKALSVFHPKVEAHYRELLSRVLAQFPGLHTLYLYNEDAGSANIWPPTEPNPAIYPRGYDGYPDAAHLHLIKLLQDEGSARRSDFRVATATAHWYQPDELRRKMVAELPPQSILITFAAWDANVDTTLLSDWTRDLCRQALERGDLTLLAENDFTGTSDDLLMEITAGLPMPLRTYRKCHAWAAAGVHGIMQHHTGGPTFGVNSITDLAFREFSWRPLVTLEQAGERIRALLSLQLYGEEAAQAMWQACCEVDKAMDAIEAGDANRPYISRLWHSRSLMFPSHLKTGLRREGVSTSAYCGDGIDPHLWRQTLLQEVDAYAKALEYARRACALAPTDQAPFHQPRKTSPALTCRDYAAIASDAIEIVLRFKQSFLNFLDAEQAAGSDLASVWRLELENDEALLAVLQRRERWQQSPYGQRILRDYRNDLEQKVRCLQRCLKEYMA